MSESVVSDGSSDNEEVEASEPVTEENTSNQDAAVPDKFYLPQLEALNRFREATDTLQTLPEITTEVNSQFDGSESESMGKLSNVEYSVFSREEDNQSEESFGSSHSIVQELPPVQLRRYANLNHT